MKLRYGNYELPAAEVEVVVRWQPLYDDQGNQIGHVETWTVIASRND